MRGQRRFESFLAPEFDRFVALRRAGGADFGSQKDLLLTFDRYLLSEANEPPLDCETVARYLASKKRSPRSQDNVVSVLWRALGYAKGLGAAVESLPERPRQRRPHSYWRQRQPRIVSAEEITRMMASARALPRQDSLRPATTATIIGLLCATGIRVGEARALNIGDFDRDRGLLTILHGKFGKTRVLPLRESTCRALASYIDHPLRPVDRGSGAPIFVSSRRRRLAEPTLNEAFQVVCEKADLSRPWPRKHDLRHTFAVSWVVDWYRRRRDVDALLPALSTYLGHCSVENTRLYLVANGAILQQAAKRFAKGTRALDEVLS